MRKPCLRFLHFFQAFFTTAVHPLPSARSSYPTRKQRARKTEYRALEHSLIIINFIPDKKDCLLLINTLELSVKNTARINSKSFRMRFKILHDTYARDYIVSGHLFFCKRDGLFDYGG